jgi:hypothetical protein
VLEDDITSSGRPLFLRALRAALARPPLFLLAWGVPLLLALVVVGPWMGWTSGTLANRYEPGSVRASMSEVFRQDHGEALTALGADSAASGAFLAVLMMLFGAFTAGGWLQVFLERTSGHSVRRFLWGGAKYFWRFLRVWVLTILALAFFSWVLHGWPWITLLELLFGAEAGDLEVVTSEWTAVWVGWIQAGLFAFLFALTMVWGDYTRTRLALHDGRSALWAGICSLFLIIAHPVRTLRPLGILFALEVLVVTSLGTWAWGVNTGLDAASTWTVVLFLFVLGQVALLWQAISRAARYAAAVRISQTLVAPLAQPDPWASRIGGPGGPQYPIDDTDDYGVSF